MTADKNKGLVVIPYVEGVAERLFKKVFFVRNPLTWVPLTVKISISMVLFQNFQMFCHASTLKNLKMCLYFEENSYKLIHFSVKITLKNE